MLCFAVDSGFDSRTLDSTLRVVVELSIDCCFDNNFNNDALDGSLGVIFEPVINRGFDSRFKNNAFPIAVSFFKILKLVIYTTKELMTILKEN